MRRPGVHAVLAGILVSGVAAAAAPQERQAPPRFRVGVDVVRIDAVVTDKDGLGIRDLGREPRIPDPGSRAPYL